MLGISIATSLLVPTAHASLDLSATAISLPARQGSDINIEWTIANTSGFTRENVTMTMVFPAGVNQYSESLHTGDCPSTACEPGETVTWQLGDIPAGRALTVRFGPRIANATADGTVIMFEPTVTDDTTDTASTTLNVPVDSASLYEVALSELRDPATAGSLLTYRVSFGYLQDVPAVTNSTLRFDVPANATFVSATGGGSESGGVVSWPLGFLSPGDSGTRDVTVQLDGGLANGELVRASAEMFSVASPSDNATIDVNTAIGSAGGLDIVIEANPDPARPGDFTNIDITIANHDPFTRFGVTLSAPWPQELAQYSESQFDGDCASTACEGGETVNFSFGDIPAGGSVTTNLTPRIATTALAGRMMTLDLTARDIVGEQWRQAGDLRVEGTNPFAVTLAESADPALPGAVVTYELNYALRADAGTVANSVLRLPLPDGVSFVSASDGGSHSGGVVTWFLGVLSPGDSGTRQATVQLAPSLAAGDVVETRAELTTVTSSLDAAWASANTVMAATNGLQVAIERNVNPARQSERMNLQLVVRNTDPFTRFGVSLIGRYPVGFAQLSESLFDGNCASTACESTEQVIWSLGDIAAGDTAVVDLPAVMASSAQNGTLASLYLQAEDTLGLQARQMAVVRADGNTIFDLNVAESADPVNAGADLSYTLDWGYRADAAAVTQTVLSMPVPEGATFVSATDGGTLNSGVVEWPLGFLSPGDGGQRRAQFSVDAATANGSVIAATADMTATATVATRMRAESLASVTSASGLVLSISTLADPARASERDNFRLTVSNTDPFARFGVDLIGRYPADMAQLSESLFDGNCASTACESGEQVFWTLGEIPAGDAITVDLPAAVPSSVVDGVLSNLFIVARDDQGNEVRLSESLQRQSDTVYDVGVVVSDDPAEPGSTLIYEVTYGMREDSPSVRDSRLELRLPAGVLLQSASDGFVQNGNVLSWDLGFVGPTNVGSRTATVLIDGAAPAGSTLLATADLYDVAEADERIRADIQTVVRNTTPLSLDVDAVVFTAVPGRSINTRLTLTNNDVLPRFGVALRARMPQGAAQLFESAANFDGDCPSTACEAGEVIVWPSVDLAAGESATVTLPAITSTSAVEGSLLHLLAWAEDDQGVQSRGSEAYATGCIEALDADCDGIRDSVDNCLGTTNTDQRDTDADGIGNACDADLNGDCIVNVVDLGILRVAFFGTPGDANWNPDADFDGNDQVNVIDLGILRTLFFRPPGPSALPNACQP